MNIIKRFWSKVDKKGPDECWEWLASLRQGRGQFKIEGRMQQSHRVSWAIAHKTWPIPKDKQINHKCNNKLCVNPAHLYLGTQAQNQQDASPLTPVDIMEIRYLKIEGYTHKEISKMFPVTRAAIGLICRHKSWKNV